MVIIVQQITLKKIPDELYNELKKRADRYKRSLNSEILHTLEKSTLSSKFDPDELIEKVKGIHSKIKVKAKKKDIEEAKNWGRV